MDLQIMFGVGGEHDLSERELPHLAGWRDSRPVRVGNGAWRQRQLDVYGELLAAARPAGRTSSATSTRDTRSSSSAAADAAAARWRDTDQGIWEVRGEPRRFPVLQGDVLGRRWTGPSRWPASLGAQDRVPGWTAAREEIRAAMLAQGWNEKAGAFTQSFGSEDLDASNLMMAIVGFLPAD